MRFNKISLAAMVLSGSALLAACGGDSDSTQLPPAVVATANTTAAINPTTGATVVAAVVDKPFEFATGVPSFGTTTPTVLTLSGAGAAPSFGISSTEGTATGDMAFGSCIFTIKSSTFPAGHLLALGATVTVNPCSLTVTTNGKTAGAASNTPVSFMLGTTTSSPVTVLVSLSETGQVTVNGRALGTVTVVVGTGAGG